MAEGKIMQKKVVMPAHLNDHNVLFGGTAMKWMDEAAYMLASRYSGKKVVTVSVEKIRFLKTIYQGEVASISCHIAETDGVRLKIRVVIHREDILTGRDETAIDAMFVFAAVNNDNRPVRLDK